MGRYTAIILPCLLIIFAVCSKNNFQLVEQDDGSIVKLDTRTGEMFVLKGDTVIRVVVDTVRTTADRDEVEKPERKKTTWKPKPKSKYDAAFAKESRLSIWDDLRFEKDGKKLNARASLRSRLRDGRIEYVFRMRVVSSACWRKPSHDMSIQLQDAAGTTLKTINITAGAGSIVKQPDKRTIDICVDGEVPCDEATYGKFARWYLQWTWWKTVRK